MSLTEIINFFAIDENLASAGQPTREQFPLLAAEGYQVVINLARPDSEGALADEAGLVQACGMQYIHIPVVWEAPQSADLADFYAAMQRSAGQKVFVHCALNMRASAFIYLYRCSQLNVPEELARASMEEIWQPYDTWETFIEAHLPAD